ncbi:MAG: hypothetical protein IJ419_08000 [Agathobacter sp.]|nr:hypothetical protein [Agathobacter sp.]
MLKKINWNAVGFFALVAIVFAILIGGICFLGQGLKEKEEFEAWYNSLSAEEQAEYEAPYTTTYEVIAVNKHNVNITNRYGGVRGTYICYEFYYVDENGEIVVVNDFRDDWGREDVVIGESNTYSINARTDCNTLTITKDTLLALSDVVTVDAENTNE